MESSEGSGTINLDSVVESPVDKSRWSQVELFIFDEKETETEQVKASSSVIMDADGLFEFREFSLHSTPTEDLSPSIDPVTSTSTSQFIHLLDDRAKIPFPLSKAHHRSFDLMDFETPALAPRQPSASNSIDSANTAVGAAMEELVSSSEELVESVEDGPEIRYEGESDTDVELSLAMGSSSEEEEEEDPDSSPIFSLISTSTSTLVKAAWESTTLILVPPQKTLPSALTPTVTSKEQLKPFEFVKGSRGEEESTSRVKENSSHLREAFLRLHCFELEDRSLDTWKSIGTGVIAEVEGFVEIRLEASKGRVHVSWVSVQTGERIGEIRKVALVKEANIYRKLKATTPTPSLPTPRPKTPSKSGFRAPKWLRRGSASNSSTLKESTPILVPPVLARVRVIALDGEVVMNWPGSEVKKANSKNSKSKPKLEARGTESSLERESSGRKARLTGETAIPVDRNFISDLMFLISPPTAYADLKSIFHSIFSTIVSAVQIFQDSFLYIKGFDTYTVQRIRRGILEKGWSELSRAMERNEDLDGNEMNTLLQLLENVVIGLLHTKIYASSLLPLYMMENTSLNTLLELYRARCSSPSDLGIDLSLDENPPITADSLSHAISIMSRLDPDAISADTLPTELLIHFTTELGLDLTPTLVTLTEARTPLESVAIFKATLQEVVSVVELLIPGTRVTTDMLIPLLAFVIVKSGAEDLESLTYYLKSFRMGGSLAAELDWSFVTFQASLAFLRSDPLGALQRTGSPTPSLVPKRASDLSSFSSRAGSSPRSSRTQPKNLGSQHRAQTRAAAPGPPVLERECGQMLPPISSTIKHQRRQSLGLPSGYTDRSRVTTSLYEVSEVKRTHHSIVRKASFDSSPPPVPMATKSDSDYFGPSETFRPRSNSSSSVTSIRSRIVLPSGLGREHKAVVATRVLGGPRTLSSSVSSSDMRRNHSDRSAKRSSGADAWPLWNPQSSTGSSGGEDQGQSWMEWGRERLGGSEDDHGLGIRRTITHDSAPSVPNYARTTSLDSGFDPPATARMVKVGSLNRKARPSSILSISSISSIDHLDFSRSYDTPDDLTKSTLPEMIRTRKLSSVRGDLNSSIKHGETSRLPLAPRVDYATATVASLVF